jgi:hypothetical protein
VGIYRLGPVLYLEYGVLVLAIWYSTFSMIIFVNKSLKLKRNNDKQCLTCIHQINLKVTDRYTLYMCYENYFDEILVGTDRQRELTISACLYKECINYIEHTLVLVLTSRVFSSFFSKFLIFHLRP